MKNYGLDLSLEKQALDGTEWQFGGKSAPCIAVIPPGDRKLYLPEGEVQRSSKDDMMDCVSRAFVNTLETKFNYLLNNKLLSGKDESWLRMEGYITENGIEFADAFIAILSNTTRSGNSMKAPVHAIHKYGLVPKSLLPLENQMTWDEYHDPARITPQIKALGAEFLSRFPINYEIVYEKDFTDELKNDILNVASFAWAAPEGGIYLRIEVPPNHAYIIFDGKWEIFDNYIDTFRGDFFKNLAPDYDFLNYGYRVYISKKKVISRNWLIEFIRRLYN